MRNPSDMRPLTPADLPSLRRLADFLERRERISLGVLAKQVRRIIFRLEDSERPGHA